MKITEHHRQQIHQALDLYQQRGEWDGRSVQQARRVLAQALYTWGPEVKEEVQRYIARAARRDVKKSPAQLEREITKLLAKEPGSGAPRVLSLSRGRTFAGRRSITARVQYPGEAPSRVEFVGPSAGVGGSGPVVMIARGHESLVTDPSRFGDFGPEWIRRFFS